MSKKPKTKPTPKPLPKIELRPDGYERFRAAVHAAAKSGPKPAATMPRLRKR